MTKIINYKLLLLLLLFKKNKIIIITLAEELNQKWVLFREHCNRGGNTAVMNTTQSSNTAFYYYPKNNISQYCVHFSSINLFTIASHLAVSLSVHYCGTLKEIHLKILVY